MDYQYRGGYQGNPQEDGSKGGDSRILHHHQYCEIHRHTIAYIHTARQKTKHTQGLVRHSKITCNRKPKMRREKFHPVTNHLPEYSAPTVLLLAKLRVYSQQLVYKKTIRNNKKG